MGDNDEQMFARWEARNLFRNNNNNNMNDYYYFMYNNNNNNNMDMNNNIEERFVPSNAENSIMAVKIKDGNRMANFHNEFQKGRYYKSSTLEQINPRRNPFTRELIRNNNIKYYRAKIKPTRTQRRRMQRQRAAETRRRAERYAQFRESVAGYRAHGFSEMAALALARQRLFFQNFPVEKAPGEGSNRTRRRREQRKRAKAAKAVAVGQ